MLLPKEKKMRLLGLLYRCHVEIRALHSLSLYYKTYVSPSVGYYSPVLSIGALSILPKLKRVLTFFYQ